MIDVDADAATPTQSPTAGKSAAEDDSWRKRPLTSAQPCAPPSMRYSPRCSSTTRAQARPVRHSSLFVLLNLLFEETVPAQTFE